MVLGRRSSAAAAAFSARCAVPSGPRSLRVVAGAVASCLGAVAVARRSWRRCFRCRAGAPGTGMAVPLHSRRRDGRPPLFRGGGRSLGVVHSAQRLALSAYGRRHGGLHAGGGRRRAALTAPLPMAPRWRSWRRLGRAAALAAACRLAAALPWRCLALYARRVVLGGSLSLRVVAGAVASSLGPVAVTLRSRRRCLRRHACASGTGLAVAPRSRQHDARPLLFRGGGSLSWRGAGSIVPPRSRRRCARPPLFRGGGSLSARCVVLGGSHFLRVAVGAASSSLGAAAVARRSRRSCLRRRAGASSTGLVVPLRSRRRGAWPPLFRGGGSLSRRGA